MCCNLFPRIHKKKVKDQFSRNLIKVIFNLFIFNAYNVSYIMLIICCEKGGLGGGGVRQGDGETETTHSLHN